jgi:hypothetical protein
MTKVLFRRGGMMAVCLMMILMTACGNSPSGPVPTATAGIPPTDAPTETPQPTATADPQCRRRELEDWLQSSAQHSRGMMATLNEAAITPRDRIGDYISRIATIRNLIDDTTLPACASESKQAVMTLFEIVIARLTAFSNGEEVDMQQLVNDANGLYEVVKLKDAALRDLYQTLPREE